MKLCFVDILNHNREYVELVTSGTKGNSLSSFFWVQKIRKSGKNFLKTQENIRNLFNIKGNVIIQISIKMAAFHPSK